MVPTRPTPRNRVVVGARRPNVNQRGRGLRPPFLSMLYTTLALGGAFKVSPVLHSACTLRVRQRLPRRECRTGLFVCGAHMQEVWKPVPGYEGLYEVSDQGRVRSLDRDITQKSRWGTWFTLRKKGKLLRPGRMPQGHQSVALGRRNSQCVHKLVLMAFVGPAPDRHECCHNNGDPSDNRLENLRWGTRRENILDAVKHGHWMTVERRAALEKGRATRWGRR